jgi:hypothetical protein
MDVPPPDMDAGLSGRQQEAPQAQRTGMNEMNNDALVAALGMDVVAAVHGYRLAARDEAAERGIYLVSEPLSGVIDVSPGECVIVDPIDIRLAFVHTSGRRGLAGRTLTWGPEYGWAISYRTASGPPCFYAGPGASPLDLIPTPPQVLDWAVGEPDGNSAPPAGVDLDEDPEAIQRLLGFRDLCSDFSTVEAFLPASPRAGRS